MQRVLITGASGMLGEAIWKVANCRPGTEAVATGRTNRHGVPDTSFHKLDLTDERGLDEMLKKLDPDVIIHCAALTNHSECESSSDLAEALHVEVPRSLAAYCHERDKRLVHISTEAVYGIGGPHFETSECNPSSVYASSKLRGERAVLLIAPKALVLRCTPVGCPPTGEGKTLGEWLFGQLGRSQSIAGFDDVFFSPISSHILAELVFDLLEREASGILNCGCVERLSKYDFAVAFSEAFGFSTALVRRGKRWSGEQISDGSLDVSRLAELTESAPPSLHDVLQSMKLNR